jgi:hypothetical protein
MDKQSEKKLKKDLEDILYGWIEDNIAGMGFYVAYDKEAKLATNAVWNVLKSVDAGYQQELDEE